MHALPEKLSALRHEIEAGVQRRLAEQVHRLEEQIQSSAARTEQCAFQRAETYFAPRLQEICDYIDAQIAPVVTKASDNSAEIASFVASVRKEIQAHMDDLNTRLINVHAELPLFDDRLKDLVVSIGKLESAQPGISKAIDNAQEQMRLAVMEMQSSIEKHCHHAEEEQASVTLQVQEIKQTLKKGAASTEASFHQMRQALHRTSLLDEHVHSRLEEFNDLLTQELASIRTDHSGLAKQAPQLIRSQSERVQEQFATLRQHFEERLAPLEFQLRGEFKTLVSEVTSTAETIAERTCEHAVAASQEVDARRSADRNTLVVGLQELRGVIEVESARSSDALRNYEASAAAAALEAEHRASTKFDQRFAHAMSALRRENTREREAQSNAEVILMKQLREELRCSELRCQMHVEGLSAHCEAAAAAGARSAVVGLSGQSHQRSLDAPEVKTSSTADTEVMTSIASQQAYLNLEVAEFRQRVREENNELRAELQHETCEIAVASANARGDSSCRLSSVESALDRQRGQLERVDRNLREHCDSAFSELSAASAGMQHKVASLDTELASVRSAATSLTQGVLKGLQVIGLFQDSVDVLPPRAADGSVPAGCRQWGPGLEDLLEWEDAGMPLASRIEQRWRTVAQPGASALPRSLLALVQQKADGKDVLKLSSALRRRSMDAAGSPPLLTPAASHTEHDRCSHSVDGWACMDKLATGQKFALPAPRGPLAPLSGRKIGSTASNA